MTIDVHAHVYPTDYLDHLADKGVTTTGNHRGLGADDSPADLTARFEQMDRAGIDLQVLSAAPLTGALPDPHDAADAARRINDRYLELVHLYPDRFRAFAALPLPYPDAAAKELERIGDEPGVVGVTLTTSALGRSITDSSYTALWEEFDRRGTAIYLHPSGTAVESAVIRDSRLTWMVGALVEDLVTAAQLVTRGYPLLYPKTKIINSHLGGAVPMVLNRWDGLAAFEAPDAPATPSEAARRMWYDTVTHGSTAALRAAIDTLGADRLLLGSDFPYQSENHLIDAVSHIHKATDERQAGAILAENAKTLLGIG